MTPNCGVYASEHVRLGRLCEIPSLNTQSAKRIQTLREHSFQVHWPKLFNALPSQIRNLTKCSVLNFKTHLDKVLAEVPDEPSVSGTNYTPTACELNGGKPSNSIIDRIRGVQFKSQLKNKSVK